MNSVFVNKYSELKNMNEDDKSRYQNISSQISLIDDKFSTDVNGFNIIHKSKNTETNISDKNPDDPLFKVIFKDELVARKYRKRIEDILKQLISLPISDIDKTASSDLVLDVYDLNFQNHSDSHIFHSTVYGDAQNNDNDKKRKREEDNFDSSYFKKQNKLPDIQSENESSDDDWDQISNTNSHETSTLETWFESECLEIESYGYFQNKNVILIAENGLTLFIPFADIDKGLQMVYVEMNEISKLSLHFDSCNPSLCFYLSKVAIKKINNVINLDKSIKQETDSDKDVIFQKLTILPKTISNETKDVIRNLFKNKIMFEIDTQIADHLNRVSPIKNKSENSELEQTNSVDPIDDESNQQHIYYNATRYNGQFETLFCRIIMIGSYENAKRRKFYIANDYIKISVPHLNNDAALVTFTIQMDDIIKIALSFSVNLPLLSICISEKAAQMIREALNMNDPNGPYIDPKSEDDILQKIVILPNIIISESKVINNWFNQGKIEVLEEEKTEQMFKIFLNKHEEREFIKQEENKNLMIHYDDSIEILSMWLRIGSYNCDEQKFTVFLNGFIFNVPNINTRKCTNIIIKSHEILKVQQQISKRRCHLLLHLNKESAERIRMELEMLSTGEGPCIDVDSHRSDEKVLAVSFRLYGEKVRYILRTLLSKIKTKEKITPSKAKCIIENQIM